MKDVFSGISIIRYAQEQKIENQLIYKSLSEEKKIDKKKTMIRTVLLLKNARVPECNNKTVAIHIKLYRVPISTLECYSQVTFIPRFNSENRGITDFQHEAMQYYI